MTLREVVARWSFWVVAVYLTGCQTPGEVEETASWVAKTRQEFGEGVVLNNPPDRCAKVDAAMGLSASPQSRYIGEKEGRQPHLPSEVERRAWKALKGDLSDPKTRGRGDRR